VVLFVYGCQLLLPMRTFRIRDSSLNFKASIALVLALALWLQPVTGFGGVDHIQSAVDGVTAVAPATPALAIRFGESVRIPRHADAGHLFAILQPGFADLLPAGPARSAMARNGFVARHSLALTFPYDATAPPAFLRT
jgi:hypothetical protein